MTENMQRLSFSVWPIPLTSMASSFMDFFANDTVSFFTAELICMLLIIFLVLLHTLELLLWVWMSGRDTYFHWREAFSFLQLYVS